MTNSDVSPILSSVAGAMSRTPEPQSEAETASGAPSFADSVAWHYGNPLTEQRVVETGVGVVDLSFRRIIAVTGPERLTWLNTLLSQELETLPDGHSTRALNLDAQGHVLDEIRVTELDGTAYLEVDRGVDKLLTFLTRMIFWSDVQVELTDLTVLALLGSGVGPNVSEFGGLALPSAVDSAVRVPTWPEGFIRRVAGPSAGAVELIVPRGQLVAAFNGLIDAGAQPLGLLGYEAERVNWLKPIVGVDTDERTIPHEAPSWIGTTAERGAVHLDKGCYRGQETVSRVHNLGRSPRVLVLLHLDGSAPELPIVGAAVTAGGRTVGRLGSVVQHMDYGPIALALIKRAAVVAAELTVGDVSVQIDPATMPGEEAERPGRVAINKLRGRG